MRIANFILRYLLLLIVLGAVGAGLYGASLFYRAMPGYAGQVPMAGLASDVRVVRDSYGVPHIFANSSDDAVRALGYLHASERLFQMDMNRRAGQGRLAEAVGSDMLGVDKFTRTLGLYDLAQSSYRAMSPEAQKTFQAYADGVNAWLSTHGDRLPPEFLLLGFKPEPWKPADSIVWGKLMALQLSQNYHLEKLRMKLAGTATQAQMNALFPPPGNVPVTTEPRPLKESENDVPFNSPPLAEKVRGGVTSNDDSNVTPHPTSPARGEESRGAIADAFDKVGQVTSLTHGASNEWVIAGSRTQSGKPILANDPHLSLEAPILWYLARIVTPSWSIKGATVPGLPVVLLGQNDHIAWGFTTTNSDVEDLFIETVDPANVRNYMTPFGSKPFDARTEIIHVKDGADVTLKVRTTRHGPVLSDIDEDMAQLAGDHKVMALAFTGLGKEDTSSEALLKINHAEDWKQLLEALKLYQAPPQNVAYADTDGHIGFFNPGLMPVRATGQGLVPVDGASGDYDWIGMVPFQHLAWLYDPKSDYIFNANNAIVPPDFTPFLGSDWDEPYRAERLQAFFDKIHKHTLDTSAAMQGDHLSMVAKLFLPVLAEQKTDDPRLQQALDMLRGWNGVMDKNRPEPAVFEAWLYQMHQILLVKPLGLDLKEKGPFAATSIAYILQHGGPGFCKKSQCEDVILEALGKGLDMLAVRQGLDMTQWTWGREQVTLLRHKVFSHVPVIRDFVDLSVPSSGDYYTLDRGGSFDAPDDMPFARTHGGGYRGIYDLGDPDKSRFMITTGQSGHIFSKHFGDLVPLWNDVKAITLSGSEAELTAQGLPELVFEAVK